MQNLKMILAADHRFSIFTFSDLTWMRQAPLNQSYLVSLLVNYFNYKHFDYTFIQQVDTF